MAQQCERDPPRLAVTKGDTRELTFSNTSIDIVLYVLWLKRSYENLQPIFLIESAMKSTVP